MKKRIESVKLMAAAVMMTGVPALGGSGAVEMKMEADALDESFGGGGSGFWDRFDLGSYGELHGRVGDGEDNVDLHRLVMLGSARITDKLRFVTEVEFEHLVYDGESGGKSDYEIEIEQAYFEYALRDDLLVNAGIQLVPVGIINLTHEPTTFQGVERPNVEKYILPSTWWEGAVSVVKTYESGLQLDVMLHTAMDMDSDGYIRSGRPKLDLNEFTGTESWGVTMRAKYTGISGVELGAALQYQDDVSSSVSGNQETVLAEAHGIYRKGGFELRALGAYWNVSGFGDSEMRDQWGYYVEPSYSWETKVGRAGVFARFSHYDYYKSGRNETVEYAVGASYWPMDEVVLKVDYVNAKLDNDINDETFNFGLGYYF
ncbi:MAG: porin [Verrucomicrobiales bacterium]|nr:porin [Verrucomicrobiota bacterium JB025]